MSFHRSVREGFNVDMSCHSLTLFPLFSISRSQVLTRSLQLSVWHHDRLGRNAFLGEVEVPLDCRDLDGQHEECVALMGKVRLSRRHHQGSELFLIRFHGWNKRQALHINHFKCISNLQYTLLTCSLVVLPQLFFSS